ncbi:Protease Do-like 5, chloroplastic [Vitis vinifera]|uniref:Protease Do-like 5, chloroplastic n=1 Tax=Vitis vinifera TaxID=29760 RepID=A0A438DHI6_VITVI|nr:Protease Do-like 5, chloroplastic [Vitis vinifera]
MRVGVDVYPDGEEKRVDIEGNELKPVVLGTSRDIRVVQVVSGLGREIPSPNGKAIRGAIQTDAAINSGEFSKFLLKIFPPVSFSLLVYHAGTGVSSGVNFAIPIDTVVRTVPYLIVYGTPYSNRY